MPIQRLPEPFTHRDALDAFIAATLALALAGGDCRYTVNAWCNVPCRDFIRATLKITHRID
ncbi:MAG: hypothetical protein ACXABY_06420 [Candidatus Thorarchaeota archaeon]